MITGLKVPVITSRCFGRNSTAAVVSEHFGYPVFMAASALWIAPRSPLARLLLLYPPLVLCVIVGTGRHWVLDGAVGTLTVAFGLTAAWLLHRNRPPPAVPAPEPLVRAIALAVGYGLAIDFADALSAGRVSLTDPSAASLGVPLLIAAAAVLASRAPPG